jgi:hypothetical protein
LTSLLLLRFSGSINSAVERMFDRWEVPDATEAHQVELVVASA